MMSGVFRSNIQCHSRVAESMQTMHMGTAQSLHDHSHAVSVLSINCQLLHAYRLPVLMVACSYHTVHRDNFD